MTTQTLSAITLALLLASTVACSEDANEAAAAGDPASGAGGMTGQGGATSGVGGDTTFSAGVGGTGQGGGETCLTEEATAEPSPLDIVVILDRSNSMAGSLWNGTVTALSDFFNNPGATDISASLSYFPPPNPNASECNPNSYNPPMVPLVDLANSAATLVNDLSSQSPLGDFTPTYGALYGTLQYANQYQDNNLDHVVIVVLASDGDPTSCDTNVSNIAAIASTAYAYNGVQTFVIAIQGATVANLDQIAAAGGTGQALDVTMDINQFKAKMDEIRRKALACEYVIPDTMGQQFDPTKLNVDYTPGGMGMKQTLPQAQDEADCGNNQGWYYDNNNNPTKVIFCPATCADLEQDAAASINFVFGCPTVVN